MKNTCFAEPTFLSLLLITLRVKQASASEKPVTNQGFIIKPFEVKSRWTAIEVYDLP